MKCSLKTNIIIDLVLFAAAALTSISGIVLKFFRPHLVREMRHLWREIHTWAGIAMLFLLAVHIICHWNTIDGFFKKHITNAVLRWAIYVVLLLLLIVSVVPWLWAL